MGGRGQGRQARLRNRAIGEGRGRSHPRDRPGSRRRGDLLAHRRSLEREARLEGRACRARHLQRHHPRCGRESDVATARHRSGAGRCLSRAARARLSRRLQPVARVVAQASRRALGREGAVGRAAPRLRSGARDRALRGARILVDRRAAEDAGGCPFRNAPRRRGRREDRAARRRHGKGGRGLQGRARRSDLPGRPYRGEARQAAPLPALHHIDLAAGSLAQARPVASGDDAHCAAALRRRERRRRNGRPHHLYADRRRRHGARGRFPDPTDDRDGARQTIPAGCTAPLRQQGEERPGGA